MKKKNSAKIMLCLARNFVIITLLFEMVIYANHEIPASAQSIIKSSSLNPQEIINNNITSPNIKHASNKIPGDSSLYADTSSNPSVQPDQFKMESTEYGYPIVKYTIIKHPGIIKLNELPISKVPQKSVENPEHGVSSEVKEYLKEKYTPITANAQKTNVITPSVSKYNPLYKILGDPTVPFFGFLGMSGGGQPPDVSVAVGKFEAVETINTSLDVFAKYYGTEEQWPVALNAFLGNSDSIADPKVIYDTTSSRFFISFIDETTEDVDVIVSVSDYIGDGFYAPEIIPFSPNCPDQPILAVSGDKVVISVDPISGACVRNSPSTAYQQFIIIDKESLIEGSIAPYQLTDPRGYFGEAIPSHPISNADSSNRIFSVTKIPGEGSPLADLIYFDGTVPQAVVHEKGIYQLDAGDDPTSAVMPPNVQKEDIDDRVLTGAYSDTGSVQGHGQIWFAFHEGCSPQGDSTNELCFHLVQIDPDTTCNPHRGEGLVCGSPIQQFDVGVANTSVYYPALSLDYANDLSIIFGESSSSISPSLFVTGQSASDPPTTLSPMANIVNGVTCSTNGGNYGDYFGAATDPTNPKLVWVAGEFSPPNCYFTFISEIETSSTTPPTPAIPDFASLSCYADSTIFEGVSPTITCTIASKNQFNGTVTLSSTVSGYQLTGQSYTSVTVPISGSATAQLSINPICNTSSNPQISSVTITATANVPAGNLAVDSNTVTINFLVPLPMITNPHANNTPTTTTTVSGTVTPVPTPHFGQTNPYSPPAGAITFNPGMVIKGTALPNSVISIYDEQGQTITNLTITAQPIADQNGHWEFILPQHLPSGLNRIYATSWSSCFGTTKSGNQLDIWVPISLPIPSDFTMTLSQNQLAVQPGQPASTSVTITWSQSNYQSPVGLTLPGLPPGVTYSFSPPLVSPTSNGSSQLVVLANSSVSKGQYTVYVAGNAGRIHYIPLTLVIS